MDSKRFLIIIFILSALCYSSIFACFSFDNSDETPPVTTTNAPLDTTTSIPTTTFKTTSSTAYDSYDSEEEEDDYDDEKAVTAIIMSANETLPSIDSTLTNQTPNRAGNMLLEFAKNNCYIKNVGPWCLNGGRCYVLNNKIACRCPPNVDGEKCEKTY
ncbi:hypothetical protein PVAND_009480 [Polypedilum vanderplanki]|uniref:EGF-like domain-containing protein n=1 Tax=Polypedilum vanderplanki TaxID=319348 RepID=A0A9J6CCQ1_POLVA|nr:hypothetical protein PVAND_009480 [Polypedilum vanderplanki]